MSHTRTHAHARQAALNSGGAFILGLLEAALCRAFVCSVVVQVNSGFRTVTLRAAAAAAAAAADLWQKRD